MHELKLVAVTACVSGVAHTYMAAEQLEKLSLRKNYRIKIETQGALGIENKLSGQDIAEADIAILVSDISIEGYERFSRCRIIKMGVQDVLVAPERLLAVIEKARGLPRGTVLETSQ